MPPFYGREVELSRLQGLLKKKTSSLVVIKGRRRIGKSRLILEFSEKYEKKRGSFKNKLKSLIFIGLPPEKHTTPQIQREYFVQQMERLLGIKGLPTEDWGDIFWNLAQATKSSPFLIVLDEINWMGSCDHTFLGKLKSAWDLNFKNNPHLVLILSGSMSTWIDHNILSSTGFMGRVSLELSLDELPLPVCNLFWRKNADFISAYEKFKVLCVTGGVPRYLEEIDPDLTSEKNIYQLAFRKGGLLVEEFDRIFSDLFAKRSARYKQIVEVLVDGSATLEQICRVIHLEKSGVVSGYLEDLVETGYVAQDHTWSLKSGKTSNLSRFRLKDNYLRFYLKYIGPKRTQIEKNRIVAPPNWTTIMGIQFENLVLNNVHLIHEMLGVHPHEVVLDNPYFQRASKAHAGCQIDYLIQTQFNTLFVCEIKFLKDEVGLSIVKEVQQKIQRMVRPKGFSVRPVLVHVNGVSDAVLNSEFFSKIIDFSEFLCRR